MKLYDFLILLLQAHAQTLLRLAALFGEDALVEMLEMSGERERAEEETVKFDPRWLRNAARGSGARLNTSGVAPSPYRALEGAVHDIGLPAVLEFHLWAYPFYRTLIEGDVDLEADLAGPAVGENTPKIPIIDIAIAQSEKWVHGLPIPPSLSVRAEQAARTPWMRFRTDALRKMGIRPFGVVPLADEDAKS